jgi:hypothetical protein
MSFARRNVRLTIIDCMMNQKYICTRLLVLFLLVLSSVSQRLARRAVANKGADMVLVLLV